jgi:beta-hydroxylase
MSIHPKESLVYRVLSKTGKSLIGVLEFFISKVTEKKYFFETAEFPWVQEVEKMYPTIAKEFETFYQGNQKLIPDITEISEEQYQVVKQDEWRFIPFLIYGKKVESFCRQFPVTASTIEKIPSSTTAFFSILHPHVKIAEHRGAYKGYLRYHLGVKIPTPVQQCGIKIKDETFHWENGKSIIFDDTYQHSAWNNSNEIRVVLYVDFIRTLPFVLKQISVGLTKLISMSPFVKNGLVKLNNFEKENQLQKLLG